MHNNPNPSWKSVWQSVNIRKGLQVVHQEAIWKVKLYNKPMKSLSLIMLESCPTAHNRKGLAQTQMWAGTTSNEWECCVKNKLGNKHQKFANLYPKGFAYEVLCYCYHWSIGNNQVTTRKVNRKVLYRIVASTQCLWETMQVRQNLFIYE